MCEKIVLSEVAAKGLDSSGLVQDGLAHEGGHPGGAVDAQHVGSQVHASVARAEVHLKTEAKKNTVTVNLTFFIYSYKGQRKLLCSAIRNLMFSPACMYPGYILSMARINGKWLRYNCKSFKLYVEQAVRKFMNESS